MTSFFQWTTATTAAATTVSTTTTATKATSASTSTTTASTTLAAETTTPVREQKRYFRFAIVVLLGSWFNLPVQQINEIFLLDFSLKNTWSNLGSGCGAVRFQHRRTGFESSHEQFFQIFIDCYRRKEKNKEKTHREWPIIKKKYHNLRQTVQIKKKLYLQRFCFLANQLLHIRALFVASLK